MPPLPSFRSAARTLDPVHPPDRLRGLPDHRIEQHLRVDELGWLGYLAGENETLHDLCPTVGDGVHSLDINNVSGYVNRTTNGLSQFHRHLSPPDPLSLRGELRRHDREHGAHVLRVLWYNTFMLRAIKVTNTRRNQSAEIEAKPDIDARRSEIGAAIERAEYDIVGLCEVFSPEDRDALLAEIPDHDVAVGVGTPSLGGGNLEIEGPKGSGLTTLTRGPASTRPQIIESERIAFSDQGYALRDTDAYANKGVLFTRIDMEVGKLDLYTTHIIFGGDIPPEVETIVRVWRGISTLGLSEIGFARDRKPVRTIRRIQVRELAAFIQRTRDPRNPVVVLGDFNIAARAPARTTEYQDLLKTMYHIGLQDAWLSRGSPWGGTESPEHSCIRDDSDEPLFRCQDYPDGSPPSDPERIDFVFVELPSRRHSFNLDVSRIRRASFWRGSEHDPRHLSDHLGLDFTLVASPG